MTTLANQGEKRPTIAPSNHWVDTLAAIMERVVPDAITTSIFMLVALFGLAMALGSSFTNTMESYYRGLLMLLEFTMQMTLILVLSLILGATPFFKKAIVSLSRLPSTQTQVMVLAVLCGSFVAYLNWGLSIALAPVIAIHFATQAERKGIPIDFLWLMSVLAGIGTAGVPGGSLPMVLIVAQSIGVPAEGMGLILGVDRFLDMCRTAVNVSGDLVIAALVSGPPAPEIPSGEAT